MQSNRKKYYWKGDRKMKESNIDCLPSHDHLHGRIYSHKRFITQHRSLPEREVTAYQKVRTNQCYCLLSYNGRRKGRAGTQSCHCSCWIRHCHTQPTEMPYQAEIGAAGCRDWHRQVQTGGYGTIRKHDSGFMPLSLHNTWVTLHIYLWDTSFNLLK